MKSCQVAAVIGFLLLCPAGFASTGADLQAQAAPPLPALPAGFPRQIEFGCPIRPAAPRPLRATAPFRFRYQYLAGGREHRHGWSTWNTNGDFAKYYIQESAANGIIPVFTYYHDAAVAPWRRGSESRRRLQQPEQHRHDDGVLQRLKLFFQRAGAFTGQRVVLHVEPDLWGYCEQRATNDNAATVPAKVSETGLAGAGRVCRATSRVSPRR